MFAPVPEFNPHFRPTKYLTDAVPGIGGVLKQRDEDFKKGEGAVGA